MPHHVRMIFIILGAVFVTAVAGWYTIHRDTSPARPHALILAHDKGNLPTFQDNFSQQGLMAQSVLGIGITPVPSTTPDLYRYQMKTGLSTNQPPDLFTWWSGFQAEELVHNDYVLDLTALWDKYEAYYSPDMREVFTVDGKVYGFPYVTEYWPVWYNKTIFTRLNLKEPSTWKEFIAVCEALKASGVTPILSSLQNEWPAFIWFEEMMIGQDPGLYKDLCLGKVRYSDPRVVKACRVWKAMIEKGYFTDSSVNILTNSGYLWNKEKFGMALCGTWYYSAVLIAQGVDKNSIGAFILPSHNDAAGKNIIIEVGPLFVSKHGAHVEDALKVSDWWMSPEGSRAFAVMHKAYPGSRIASTGYLPEVKKNLLDTVQKEHYRLLNRYWEATPTPICEAAVSKLGEFILNPGSLDDVLRDIDRVADSYWTGNRP